MNNLVYNQIKKRLIQQGVVRVQELLLKIELLEIGDSITVITPRRTGSAANRKLTPIAINLERLAETTYRVNGERFGPMTEVEKFILAADGDLAD